MRKLYLLCILAFIVSLISACTPADGTPGASGQNMLIEVRDATTAECQFGGQAFVQGFDLAGAGKITQIVSTTLNCNKTETPPVIAQAEVCATCHQAQNDALVPSPHLKRSFMDASASWVSAGCRDCHTGGIYPNVANYKSIDNATSGLICSSCHNQTLAGGFGAMHQTVAVLQTRANSITTVTTCALVGCHGNQPNHVADNHPYPFADNITAAFTDSIYSTATNIHGKPSGRNTCTPCHVGGYVEAVVNSNPTLQRRATGVVTTDNKTIWTTTGGASYYVENQRTKAFGSTDNKTGFNYVAFKNGLGTWNNATDAYTGFTAPDSKLQCTNCHDKHSTALVGKEVKDKDGTVVFSKEFMTCTTCHVVNVDAVKNDNNIAYKYTLSDKYAPTDDKLVDLSGTGAGPYKVATLRSDDVAHHTNTFTSGSRNLGMSHFSGRAYSTYATGSDRADNVTITAATKATGILTFASNFNVNAGAANACTGCHDAHFSTKFAKDNSTVTSVNLITNNWANSKHAAYSTPAIDGRLAGYSSACNRCHNGRTFAYSVEGVAGANLNKVAFKTTGNAMGQTINCATCHDTSVLVDPANPIAGSLTSGFNALKLDNATRFPNAGVRQWSSKGVLLDNINPAWVQDGLTKKVLADGSSVDLTVLATSKIEKSEFGAKAMVCVQCHSGRNTGERIVESVHANGTVYSAGTPTTQRALTDYPHYMDAVGTINKNGPYNFSGKTYGSTLASEHSGIPGGFSCISCHDVKSHTFKVFKNAAGEAIYATNPDAIFGITDANTTCAICHTASGLGNTAAIKAKKGFDAAVAQLKAQLAVRGKFWSETGATVTGIYYASHWTTAPNGTQAVTSWTSTEELGAAYNTGYFSLYDTGAWAHGTTYTKQVMFDSMVALGGTFTGDASIWIGTTRP